MKSKVEKQADAIERVRVWRQMTTDMQILSLDRRLGVGIGAKKQRARIERERSR